MIKDKCYVGKVEAFEIMLERNIDELPLNGKEILTVYAKYLNKPVEVLGRDKVGYYIGIIIE